MFNDSRVYVAGHTGLLGTALLRRLALEGCGTVITRTHAELDLTDSRSVDEFFRNERPEYVFLAAGRTGGIIANKTYPATFLHTNIAIQDNVFEAACRYDVKHLIFYGSSCVYPKNSPQPIKEEYLFSGPIEDTSEAYAAAKISGIIACRAYNIEHGENRFIALVPNSMYGPNDNFDPVNSHVLSALMRKLHDSKNGGNSKVTLWGTGMPRREFIYSEDVADASIFAMKNTGLFKNTHYNIGTGIDYSIKELVEIISGIAGYTGEIEWDTAMPDGAPQKLLDSTKFLNTGWKPSMVLEKGLKTTYQWFERSLVK